jgi:hypothetical protein
VEVGLADAVHRPGVVRHELLRVAEAPERLQEVALHDVLLRTLDEVLALGQPQGVDLAVERQKVDRGVGSPDGAPQVFRHGAQALVGGAIGQDEQRRAVLRVGHAALRVHPRRRLEVLPEQAELAAELAPQCEAVFIVRDDRTLELAALGELHGDVVRHRERGRTDEEGGEHHRSEEIAHHGHPIGPWAMQPQAAGAE